MSYYEHWLEEQDRAAAAEQAEWVRTPEGREWKLKAENDRLRAEKESLERENDRRRQEREWKRDHPAAWRAWVRLQPLLELPILFGDEKPFDFDAFRVEVGHAPPGVRRVVRKDRSRPYQPGNLRWGCPRAPKSAPLVVAAAGAQPVQAAEKKDYLTKKDVAKRLIVSPRTVNRWVSLGLLKPFRRGQVLRFKPEDVETFEAKGKGGRR